MTEIELLLPERLAFWCERIDIPREAIPALGEMAAVVCADGQLLKIFTEFHIQTAQENGWMREWRDLPFDPLVQERFGDRTSQFYLLAYLAGLPYTWQKYQQLGVGEQVYHDTMLDFRYYIQDYYNLHGVWGFALFSWIWRHLTCELFRLGRLQYMLTDFSSGVTAFKHKITGEICLLADPNLPLRMDGYAWGAGIPFEDRELPDGSSWYPFFESTRDGWGGHRVRPRGYVERSSCLLSSAEWEIVLQAGETVLDLHIPRNDPFTVETCRDSLERAWEFFPRVSPDRPWKALYCHTWMFTPQLENLLKPESNLLAFQHEFYLYPYPGGLDFLWSFVFGEKYPDRATAPRDTSLRRAVLDWIDDGKEIFDLPGLMFHTPHKWGNTPYLSY